MVCVCVACGAVVEDREGRRVAQAFDQRLLANTGILKLLECRRCGQVGLHHTGHLDSPPGTWIPHLAPDTWILHLAPDTCAPT